MKVPVPTNSKLLSHYERRRGKFLGKGMLHGFAASSASAEQVRSLSLRPGQVMPALGRFLLNSSTHTSRQKCLVESLTPVHVGELPALAQGALSDSTGCTECA